MTRYSLILSIALFFLAVGARAQTTDLARVEYTYFPQSDSDNSFRRFRALVNAPIKVSENDAYIVIGAEYRSVDLKYRDGAPFSTDDLGRFQSYNLSLGYTFKLSDIWRFGARAGTIIASNFEDGINSDDLLFEGAVYFIKDIDFEDDAGTVKSKRLILGLQYNITSGRPFPLPIINYNVRASENWSYTLGVPKTNIKYYFNEKNIVQAFVTLDGFYAHVQDNPKILSSSNVVNADSISMTVVLGGLGYEHYFTDNLLFYFYGGYTILNNIRLEDENRDEVFNINDTNSFYMRGGLKFKI